MGLKVLKRKKEYIVLRKVHKRSLWSEIAGSRRL